MNPCFVPRVGPCDMYLSTSMLMITGRQEQSCKVLCMMVT